MLQDEIKVKNVYTIASSISMFKYLQLKHIIKRLKQYDDGRYCFGDDELLKVLFSVLHNYNLFNITDRFIVRGGLLIGSPHKDKSIFSIAYVLAEKYRGLGIGKDLFNRAVKTCFEDYKCAKIKLSANVDNIPSRKIIETYGFDFIEEKYVDVDKWSRFGNPVKEAFYECNADQYTKISENLVGVKSLIKY